MSDSPLPVRPTPNDPTQWAAAPGAASTQPAAPATDPTHLVRSVDLRPTSLSALQQIGNYRLIAPLGEGGMSVVFKAYHAGLDRLYALKVMQASSQMPGGPIERFLREARAVARIGKHPHIVQVHDVGESGGCYYLAMDLIEGGPLDQRLKGRPLPPRDAARIASQVARALQAAHDAGVIHRDMKPSNILLDRDGMPHVSDFGLARDTRTGVQLSQEGDILGTPLYMAPEQIAGELAQIGPATDVYGLGATLYEMLTGKPPFPGSNSHAIWLLATETEPKPPRALNPAVPPDLEMICLQSIRKSPSGRYATANDLADDLDRFLRGEPVQARPIPLVARIARKAARHRAVTALVLLILGAVAAWAGLRAVEADRVRRALEDARALRGQGSLRAAREAWRAVLEIDPGNEEARLGFDQAEQAVQRKESDRAATQALEKARRVQDVLARWMKLSGTLRDLERIFHSTKLAPEERRAAAEPAWKQVAAFMDETPQDPTSQSAMRALAGWARRLAGHEQEAREWMRHATEVDPDLPYGAFVEALACFAPYLVNQPLPPISGGEFGLHFGETPPETAAMREMRERMELLLAKASAARVWGEGLAADFQKAVTAMRALQAGRPSEADRALTEAIASPTMEVFRTELLFARAKTRYLLKRFADAVADEDAVLAVWPESAEAWYYLGAFRAGAGMEAIANRQDGSEECNQAVEAFNQAITRAPRDAQAIVGRGNTRYLLGDLDGAAADFGAVIAIAPEATEPRINRANIRLLQGRYAQAIADYDAVIARTPELASGHVGRGMVLAHQGDLDGAIAAFSGALKREPDNLWALTGRGKALRRKGDLAAAMKDFEQAVKAHPDSSEALVLRGHGHLKAGDVKKAYADYDAAAKFDPGNVDALAGRGGALVALGKVKEGIASLDAALRMNPRHVEALVNRGSGKHRLGDKAGALADYDAAVKVAPQFVEGRQMRGDVRLDMGDLAGALEDFEEVLKLAGANAGGSAILRDHYQLACIYSLRSKGVFLRDAPASNVADGRAQKDRDLAFAHLARALEMGAKDRAKIEADADLAPLHDDPRWRETLDRLK